ncbi:MAG TPA: MSHA biogenesis protein MshK [Noviherbaspirillum sp.]
MDQYLKPCRSFSAHFTVAALAAVMLMPAAVLAQGMADPTRPQTGVLAGASATAAGLQGAVLQSTLISGKHAEAIISGTLVQVGGRYGDAVVLKISSEEVVLRTAAGLQTLRLFPGIEPRAVDIRPTALSNESRQVKSK